MPIATPREPVYYYECSGGSFRLVYFIPRHDLQRLRQQGRVEPQGLEDFPDGVDLSCTEADFAEFEKSYGYRPPLAPEALQRAFFAILSSTRGWQSFRGSGMIPAADLERHVATVERTLQERDVAPGVPESLPRGASLGERRRRLDRRAARQTRIHEILEELPITGVDAGLTLRQQKFSPVEMDEGEPAEKVFAELHQKQGA